MPKPKLFIQGEADEFTAPSTLAATAERPSSKRCRRDHVSSACHSARLSSLGPAGGSRAPALAGAGGGVEEAGESATTVAVSLTTAVMPSRARVAMYWRLGGGTRTRCRVVA